jgi:hypothetical protein
LAVVAVLAALTGVACAPSTDIGRVMVVGDSISHGSSGDYTWRYRLQQHLAAHHVTADFVGPRDDLYAIATAVEGDGDVAYANPRFDPDHNATWGRTLADEAAVIAGTVAQYEPDYLLVLLGINDLTWLGASPAQVEASLRAFIAGARSAREDVAFVFGRLLPSTTSPPGSGPAARVADVNARIVALAAELGTGRSPVSVADSDAEFSAADHTWDGTHPNDRGELRIAAAFADALAEDFGIGGGFTRPFLDPPTRQPQAPVLAGEVSGSGSVTVTWTRPAGAVAFWLWSRTGDGEPWQRLPSYVAADQAPWRLSELAAGRTHQLRLQPVKTDGVFSNTISLTIPASPHAAPIRRTS